MIYARTWEVALTKENTIRSDVPILVVEDSMADFQTMQRLFKKAEIGNPVQHCETGQEAIDYLKSSEADGAGENRPGLILLDLNLPGINGREILKQIKNSDNLRSIPVVVFTTSDSEKDINECYQQGANSYITKPVDLDRFREVIDTIKSYWFYTVALPSPS